MVAAEVDASAASSASARSSGSSFHSSSKNSRDASISAPSSWERWSSAPRSGSAVSSARSRASRVRARASRQVGDRRELAHSRREAAGVEPGDAPAVALRASSRPAPAPRRADPSRRRRRARPRAARGSRRRPREPRRGSRSWILTLGGSNGATPANVGRSRGELPPSRAFRLMEALDELARALRARLIERAREDAPTRPWTRRCASWSTARRPKPGRGAGRAVRSGDAARDRSGAARAAARRSHRRRGDGQRPEGGVRRAARRLSRTAVAFPPRRSSCTRSSGSSHRSGGAWTRPRRCRTRGSGMARGERRRVAAFALGPVPDDPQVSRSGAPLRELVAGGTPPRELAGLAGRPRARPSWSAAGPDRGRPRRARGAPRARSRLRSGS